MNNTTHVMCRFLLLVVGMGLTRPSSWLVFPPPDLECSLLSLCLLDMYLIVFLFVIELYVRLGLIVCLVLLA